MSHGMSALVARLALAGARRAQAVGDNATWSAEDGFDAVLAVLRADHGGDGAADPLVELSEVFGLDGVDTELLWAAAALDLDANVGRAYALLLGRPAPSRLSVALALELIGVATGSAEAFTRLGPDGPLRRHRLLEVPGTEPWLSRPLCVPDPVVAVLAGAVPADPVVARLRMDVVPLALPNRDEIVRAVEHGVPLVWISSPFGAAGISLGAGALAEAGWECLAIDARAHLSDLSLSEVIGAAAREAGLLGSALLVAGAEVLADVGDRRVFELLERAAVPVIAVGARGWNPAWLPRLPLLIEAEPLTLTDRAAVWRSSLGGLADDDDELQRSLLGLRLGPEAVTEAARYARVSAIAQGKPVSGGIVREAARRVGGSGGSAANQIAATPASAGGPRFDDLVLPEDATASLHRLVAWAQHRDEVAALGPLRGRGRGLSALFAGSPGTGKTLAAHVIAQELSIDLFQVDLSSIVDKYIGETEKNLEKVFQAAEALDVVLFFDEADALFGSRSEVKDARDRYANQEVAYLLQRMEHFDGITILATNLRGNLDKAFSRRMSFIIHFPDPDPPTRRRLWEHHLAQLPMSDAADPIELDFLAESVELTGGDIRNIVLSAVYDTMSSGATIGMRHIVAATRREYRKLGRVVPEHGFVPG